MSDDKHHENLLKDLYAAREAKSPAYLKFLKMHVLAKDDLRIGQRFCNLYIKKPWPELFYCEDPIKTGEMIEGWLKDHQYFMELPVEINKFVDR